MQVEVCGGESGHYARKLTEEEVKKLEQEKQLSDYHRTKYEREAKKHWDLFYKRNTTRFFKDRHWITREFPELLQAISEVDDARPVLLEVGCGVGNTLFPLLEENDALFIHACDFSPRAIEFVKVIPALKFINSSITDAYTLWSNAIAPNFIDQSVCFMNIVRYAYCLVSSRIY